MQHVEREPVAVNYRKLGAVAVVVDGLDFVEALVGGDQRQQLVELLGKLSREISTSAVTSPP